MALSFPISRRLVWPGTSHPTPEQLARELAAELRGAGMRGVHQAGAMVHYDGGPWLGWNWDPFTMAPGGSVTIAGSSGGFLLRFRLRPWRVVLLLCSVPLVGLFLGRDAFQDLSWSLIGTALAVGCAWATYMDLVAVPDKIANLLSPPADEIPWSPTL